MNKPRARTPWSRRRWVLVIGAVLLAIALVAGVVLWNASRTPAGPTTDVVRATRTDETTTVSLAGVLAPQQQANVSFAVPGTVRTIDVKVGDTVTVDQQLATVGDRDLRNALSLAEAQATAARAQLQTARDADRATSAQVAAARAAVESADAAVAQARDRLADAILTSPLAGVVAAVNVEVGDQVSGAGGSVGGASLPGLGGMSGLSGIPGLSGMTGGSTSGNGATATGANIVVVVPDAWKLEVEVGTADLPQLQAGQEAIVTPTGTSQHVSAVVDTVGIVANAASGQAATFPVTLRITDPSATLFSGSNADAVVTTGTVRGVLTLPGEAIWITNGQPAVRRQVGGTVTSVEVTTGRRFGDRVEITAGLDEGDEVLARRSVVVTPPPRPQFGPGGSIVSPDPTATPER